MPSRLTAKREHAQTGASDDRPSSALGFGVQGLDVRLGVPDWIEPGDTPEGDPAVWWKAGPTENARAVWKEGGTARQAFWAFLELETENRLDRFVGFARRFGPLGLW